MRSMVWFVRACALYNICGAISLVMPGLLERFGVARPGSPFWLWLPALIGGFAAIVLFLSSSDLKKYGSFPYWNAIVRLTFVVLTFALNFGATLGVFAWVLAAGDLVLALGVLGGLPRAAGRTHLALLTNR